MMDNNKIEMEMSYILKFEQFFTYHEKIGNILRKSASASAKTRKQGNEIYTSSVPSHNKDIHCNILLLYNKSLALAPLGSEELALSYSNRSALLMHLHKYKECITDINRALQLITCENLKIKLQMRRLVCLSRISEANSEQLNAKPLPKLETSKEYPSATESVSLQYNEKYGRHLVASKDIKPGELIIIEESYTYPDENQIYLVCAHCMAYGWNGIPCDYCAFVIYCSEMCKRDAWQDYHHIECSTLPYFYCKQCTDIKTATMILTSQLFIRYVKNEGLQGILNVVTSAKNGNGMQIKGFLSNGTFDNKKFSSFYNLSRSIENTEEYSKCHGSMIIYILLRCTNILKFDLDFCKKNNGITYGCLLVLLRNIVVTMKNIIQLNAYSFQGSPCNCYMPVECLATCHSNRGICVALFCSLINHSCRPNLSRIFLPGNKIVFFTVAPIKKGDQLCDSYGPCCLTADRVTRNRYLKEKFNFICGCEACLQDWPENVKYPQGRDGKIYKQLELKTDSTANNIRIGTLFTKDEVNDSISYEDDLFQTAVIMSQAVHKYFTGFKAYSYALKFEEYIDLAMSKLYGERNYIPDSC